MSCSRNINNRTGIAYDDCTSSYKKNLEIDGSTNTKQQNIRALATEMYKVSNNLSPLFVRALLNEKNLQY